MLHVELPHVNVLSKMDLIEQYGKLGKSLWEGGLRGRKMSGPCKGAEGRREVLWS